VVDAAQEAGYQAVCASRGWPAQPGDAVVNRVTVLARQPQAYVAAVARALITRLQERVTLRLRPPHLDGELSPRGV